MKLEIQALEDNNIGEIIDLPHGKHTISLKWVYKIITKQMDMLKGLKQDQ